MKNNLTKSLLKCLVPAILIAAFSAAVAANTKEMEEAVKRYYAGYPAEAISILKPSALAGDVDAQYLLGNIIYSLSENGKLTTIDDPVKWYKMAAEQNSADAAYALGVIFHNRWNISRDRTEAANAINYYQNAVDLGSEKAREPLRKITSRSAISPQEAEVLVTEQGTTSPPEPEPEDQIPRSDSSNFEGVETLAPVGDSLADNNTATTKEADAKYQSTVENSNQTLQTAEKFNDGLALTITLAEISRHCQNYTETGFNLYAETIEGAVFSGEASMETLKPDPSNPGAYLAGLTLRQIDLVVFLNLRNVPRNVATGLEKGEKYPVTGIVVGAKSDGANCTVSATYQSIKD